MNSGGKPSPEPLVVHDLKVPWWAIAPLLFCFWPVLVYALGPNPTPLWMRTTATLSILVPFMLLGSYVLVVTHKKRKQRDSLLENLGFDPIESEALEALRSFYLDPNSITILPKAANLRRAFSGEHNGLEYELLEFRHSSGNSVTNYTIATVLVTPAPGPVAFRMARPSSARFMSIRRLRVGSPWFKKHWITHGDQATAEFLITNKFEIEFRDNINEGILCFWREDRLGFGIIGTPTESGLKYCLEKVYRLAYVTGILN